MSNNNVEIEPMVSQIIEQMAVKGSLTFFSLILEKLIDIINDQEELTEVYKNVAMEINRIKKK